METISELGMMIVLLISFLAVVNAFFEYRKERGYWRDDVATMTDWLKERDQLIKSQKETIDELQQTLDDTSDELKEWLIISNKNYKHLKRQIANLKGQITKLKKRIG